MQDGWTALHMAAWKGQVSVLRLLTEAKAHINIQTEVANYIYIQHVMSGLLTNIIDSHFLSDAKVARESVSWPTASFVQNVLCTCPQTPLK